MCDPLHEQHNPGTRTIPVQQAVGTVLAHDITEIRPGEFKGRAFKKGHVIREEDVCHLQRLGKEHLFVLHMAEDEMHENDAAYAIAKALMGDGVADKGEPKEGKIDIIADRDGLLKIDRDALLAFNMLGDVMCATLHDNTVVKKGQTVAGTRAIPLVVKKAVVEEAVRIASGVRSAECGARNAEFKSESRNSQVEMNNAARIIEVREMKRPKAGVVITGNEVYHGRIKDAFAPIITKKIEEVGGELVGIYYAPDDKAFIVDRLRELLKAGADLLITTGGMSVDPDDVTRFAIRELGAGDITYGSAVLPGAMFLVAYLENKELKKAQTQDKRSAVRSPHSELIPILGIPACGMYAKTTIFDLILPRVLAGERINRKEVAALGHGGLCMKCDVCRYPDCPFGK
ncbi:MAG: molybdopterin-binding protein [Nitrospirae bacterium GWD2_57_9]|nr:MAG: molybdopterin-binding protein [Nitrospirae bacterium GWD2_57_9]